MRGGHVSRAAIEQLEIGGIVHGIEVIQAKSGLIPLR